MMEIVKLMTVGNKIQAELTVQMLKENGINCYYKESEAGSYMEITSEFSIFGQEIFINDKDKEKAQELIKSFIEKLHEKTGLPYNKKIRKPIIIYLTLLIIMILIYIVYVIFN